MESWDLGPELPGHGSFEGSSPAARRRSINGVKQRTADYIFEQH